MKNDEIELSEELEKLTEHILRSNKLQPYSRQKLLDEFLLKKSKSTGPKKCTQDWTAYNNAQMKEKILCFSFLNDLLNNMEFPENKTQRGRKSIPTRDQIFYMVVQSYNQKSSRRCISDIEICRQLGFVEKTPHFNTVLKCLGKPENKTYLQHIINVSGIPLAEVEIDFATDSSGFSTSQFDRWFDIRFDKGRETEKRRFRKCHMTCGVKTNIIAAVNTTRGFSGDSPEFENLTKTTSKIYDIREVSADKAYLSRKNLQAVSDCGGVPFIPFKSNTRGNPKGTGIWRAMWDYFRYNREEFMNHYHKRSNSETVFHMLKMKFGKSLRSKSEIGQDNEILAKCLAHNMCVLVQEMFELGINIDFNKCAGLQIAHK